MNDDDLILTVALTIDPNKKMDLDELTDVINRLFEQFEIKPRSNDLTLCTTKNCPTCKTIMVGVCPDCGNEIGRIL